jgi:hypothetical protein
MSVFINTNDARIIEVDIAGPSPASKLFLCAGTVQFQILPPETQPTTEFEQVTFLIQDRGTPLTLGPADLPSLDIINSTATASLASSLPLPLLELGATGVFQTANTVTFSTTLSFQGPIDPVSGAELSYQVNLLAAPHIPNPSLSLDGDTFIEVLESEVSGDPNPTAFGTYSMSTKDIHVNTISWSVSPASSNTIIQADGQPTTGIIFDITGIRLGRVQRKTVSVTVNGSFSADLSVSIREVRDPGKGNDSIG